MNDSTSREKLEAPLTETGKKSVGVWSCLLGSLISGGFAVALYFLTASIAHTFAAKPISSTNPTAINISVAIRTLVVGIATLGTGIFALVAVGLVALAIQIFIQQLRNKTASS